MPEYIDPMDRMSYVGPRQAYKYRHYHWTGEKHAAPREVEAFFSLSPRTRIVIDPDHEGLPVAFLTGTHNAGHPGREHLVVAREWGDLTWPAFLEGQRHAARADSIRFRKEAWKSTVAAIRESARRIQHPIDRESRYSLA